MKWAAALWGDCWWAEKKQWQFKTRPEASRRQLKSEGQSEFTEAKRGGGGAGSCSREKKGEGTFYGRESVGHSIVSAVTSSPARMHGLAHFSEDQSDEAEGDGDGGLERKW